MGPEYRIEMVKPEHIGELTLNVREADRLEFEALGTTPARAAIEAVEMSATSWAATRDGELLCIFGVADKCILTGVGVPWMLGTTLLDSNGWGFLRRCKPAIQIMLSGYEKLENVIDARNTLAIRWLTWLGFRIYPAQPLGLKGELFHHFEMRSSDV